MSDSSLATKCIWKMTGQVHESEPVREVSITSSPFRVGRRADLPFCLDCPTVSGTHAEIQWHEDQLYVRDLNSTNGTFLNGKRVEDNTELKDGDLLQFAEIPEHLDGDQALIAVVLAGLVPPGVVAKARYGHDKTDQRNRVAP